MPITICHFLGVVGLFMAHISHVVCGLSMNTNQTGSIMIFFYGCLVSVPAPHPSTHLITLDKISTEVDTIMMCTWALLVDISYVLLY